MRKKDKVTLDSLRAVKSQISCSKLKQRADVSAEQRNCYSPKND